MAVKVNVDFTNVKDSSGINPKQMPEGDYHAVIRKVELVEKKNDPSAKQLLFTVGLKDHASVAYPYYCGFEANVLWKLRNLMIASGVKAPKKAFSFDAEKLTGKEFGVSLEDDEYDGKMKSVIGAVFPLAELETDTEDAEPETDAGDVDEATPEAADTSADEDDDELDLDAL